jgi:hypothetical protein
VYVTPWSRRPERDAIVEPGRRHVEEHREIHA